MGGRQFEAAQPRFIDVGRGPAGVIADQLVDIGLIEAGRPLHALLTAQPHLGGGRLLGLQFGVAETGVVEFVEAWRLEGGAVTGGDPQAISQRCPPGDAAGVVVAVLLVVVVAQRQLQIMNAKGQQVLAEDAEVVAAVFGKGGGAADLVVLPVGTQGQQILLTQAPVVLPADQLAAGVEAVAVDAIEVVVALIAALRQQQAAVPAGAGGIAAKQAQGLFAGFAFVGESTVVIGVAVGAQGVELQAGALAEVVTAAQLATDVAVAILVGLIGIATGADVGLTGIETVGLLAANTGIKPALAIASAQVGAAAEGTEAAAPQGAITAEAITVATAGEDLDHPANRLRAIKSRARPAHDLDALDLLHWNVLQGGGATGGRAHLDAIDQHQQVIRIAAAQE